MKSDAPSRTALLIAAATVAATRDPTVARFVTPRGAEICRGLLAAHPDGRRMLRIADAQAGRAIMNVVERCTLRGIGLHYQLRKQFVGSQVVDALRDGFRRLLVIGAGLDPLGLLVAHPGLPVTELDHPATQQLKARYLKAAPNELLSLWPCDLALEKIPSELASADTPTVVVVEGLLMYLEPGRVETIFGEIRRLSDDVRLIFTFMDRPSTGPAGFRPRSRLTERWLRRRGEPFRWDLSAGDLGGWLASYDFQLRVARSMSDLRAGAGVAGFRIDGEHVAVCDSLKRKTT